MYYPVSGKGYQKHQPMKPVKITATTTKGYSGKAESGNRKRDSPRTKYRDEIRDQNQMPSFDDSPPTIYGKFIPFINGKPKGSDTLDDLEKWNRHAENMEIETYEDLAELYSYDVLKRVFYWARSFRAGIVMIHREPKILGDQEILLVHQKEVKYFDGREMRMLPERKGPPKGESIPEDKSALSTAIREAYEETGVDILDPIYDAKLMPAAFIARRPEVGIEELIVYFVVIFETRPDIKICTKELAGYTWYDMSKGLRNIADVTSPTKRLLASLENVNWSRMVRTASLRMPSEMR